MKNCTLLFLVKRNGEINAEVCLGMKKIGFGAGRWNGAGGKIEEGELPQEAAVRETFEEIGVNAKIVKKVGELSFYFPHNPNWDQLVHVYLCEAWKGEIQESDEMSPSWFKYNKIPFDKMWSDDIFWLPLVLEGKSIKGKFTFKENDVLEEKEVEVVSGF